MGMKSFLPFLMLAAMLQGINDKLWNHPLKSQGGGWYNQFNTHKSRVRSNKNRRRR
jgi:hypothetical protein